MSVDAPELLALDRLSVAFKPGQTALGHRWILRDGDDAEVGRTKLFYEGAGKTMGRLMRVTALSTSGTIHARVLDSQGEERFRIARADREDLAFPIETPSGERLGVLTKQKLEVSAPSIGAMVFNSDVTSNQIAFQATMHLGFAGSREYHLLVERRPSEEPLATLLALTPVIAAYAY